MSLAEQGGEERGGVGKIRIEGARKGEKREGGRLSQVNAGHLYQ